MSTNHTKQFNLFEEEFENKSSSADKKVEEPVKLNGLQISEEDTKKESKLKQLITSRLKKIEKLKSLFEKDKEILVKIKTLYHKHMPDHVNELCKDIEKYTEELIKRYKQKSFSLYQRETLEYLIEENFSELILKEYSNEKLDALFVEYNKLKEEFYDFDDDEFDEDDDEYNNVFDDEFKESLEIEMMKEMLKNMGLDLDDDLFEGISLSDPDFQTKFKERFFEYAEKQKEAQQTEDKRQKTITTDKEFTKLYKSLVKKVHPDLSTDIDEKNRREELMKELSTVWDRRDYYQLLILQSKIDPDSNGGMELSKTHLELIANDLFENMKELEQERFVFKKNPENDFFFSHLFGKTDRKIKLHIENYKRQIENERKKVTNNILKLKTQKTTKAFLKSVDENLSEESFFHFH